MADRPATAESNIHLRARAGDRDLIDRASELVGANRSQFMMAASLKEAKNVLLDQSTIHVDVATFDAIMNRLDAEPSQAETEGIERLLHARAPWKGA